MTQNIHLKALGVVEKKNIGRIYFNPCESGTLERAESQS